MIDDQEKTMKLLEQLSAQLPMTVYPGKGLMETMQSSGESVDEKMQLQIDEVMYGGDEGGILCALSPWADSKQAYVVSITHLKFPREHPLEIEIRSYQKQRTLRLSVLEGRARSRVKRSKNKGFGNSRKN